MRRDLAAAAIIPSMRGIIERGIACEVAFDKPERLAHRVHVGYLIALA
jgi:hypothetical protein